MKKIVFSFLILGLISCSNYSDQEIEAFDATIQDYLDSIHVDMEKTEDGLYYMVVEEGDGEEFVKYNDKVTFAYKGSFLDGTVFHLVDKRNPLSYKVNQLIVGWQDALMMLKNGGQIKVIIPPQLGYGKKKTTYFPANSILQYELTVLDVE